MALIRCPECGSQISTKAKCCPQCGYVSNNAELPIAVQDKYVPQVFMTIESLESEKTWAGVISYDDNRQLTEVFGTFSKLEKFLPELAFAIKEIVSVPKGTHFEAIIDDELREMINNGTLKMALDKEGEILAQLRKDGKIFKQLRLKEVANASNVDLSGIVSNMGTQIQLMEILDEIKKIQQDILDVHISLQNDRIAKVEAAHDNLIQASKIESSQVRNMAIINVINQATEAKRILMRNCSQNIHDILSDSGKSTFQLIKNSKRDTMNMKSQDVINSMLAITDAVRTECFGYYAAGEITAVRECITEYSNFIDENQLNDYNTLLKLNGSINGNQIEKFNEFTAIAEKLETFEYRLGTSQNLNLLEKG